jgi:hypothetical protein
VTVMLLLIMMLSLLFRDRTNMAGILRSVASTVFLDGDRGVIGRS